jgi:hypothetical protein
MRLRRTAYFDGARYQADLIGGKGGTRTLDPGIMRGTKEHGWAHENHAKFTRARAARGSLLGQLLKDSFQTLTRDLRN